MAQGIAAKIALKIKEKTMGKPNRTIFATIAVSLLGLAGLSQLHAAPLEAWAPQPIKPAPFTAPNKPLKKFTDIMARHAGKSDWAETEVLTRDFIGQYISMAPGTKTKT